ncbi:OB-fold domain-containing protein [Salinibacterium sp. ZJ454]|uniref:Zn-ribbon domain-containing OB-fold protein n=1 Tax=Salinibacterium sp. ZJ454 TaxID=2708339 RepID=UPI0014240C4C|nr:OB-fold domain-containing protein [Salinibacterium sp. ZJ454]
MSFDHAAYQLPDPDDPELAPYWEGTRAGELRVQHCLNCGHDQWPPRGACGQCQSFDLDWVSLPTRGRLHSWTVVWHTRLADFVDRVPYAVGIIELGGGIRMIGYLDGDPAAWEMEERVDATFVQLTERVSLPVWVRGSSR